MEHPPHASGRERRTTLAALAIVLIAVGLGLGAVLTAGASPGRPTPARADVPAPTGLHVGGPGCDDAREATLVADPATPWCTLEHAVTSAPGGSTLLLAGVDFGRLTLAGPESLSAGLRVRAADPANRPRIAGMSLTSVGGLDVRQVVFTGNVGLTRVSGVTLAHDEFRSTSFYVKVSKRVTLANSHLHDLQGERRAIQLQGGIRAGQPTNEDIVLRDNLVEDVDHDAMAIYNGYERLRIEGNTIRHVRQPPRFRYHSDALQMMGGDDGIVRGNVIDDVTQAILVKDGLPSRRLRIEGNLITRVSSAGLQLYNAPGAVVERNTIWSTRYGTILANAPTSSAQTRVALRGNVLDQLLVQARGAVGSARSNVFGKGATVGAPAYRGRPRFVDPADGDFRIRSARPGAGLPAGRTPPGAQKAVG